MELILPEAKNEYAERLVGLVDKILSILPNIIDPHQFATAVIVAANEMESGKCHPDTVVIAALNAARIGLLPGGVLGLAYFIPRKQKCNLEIGYRGYLDLSYRNLFLKDVYAEVVLRDELDGFDWRVEQNRVLIDHALTVDRDVTSGPCRQNCVGAYCVYETRAGGSSARFLTRKQLDRVDSKQHVWMSDYYEMARKSAIRRASKDWKLTVEMGMAVFLDEQAERGESQKALAALNMNLTDRQETISLSSFNPGDESNESEDENYEG